MTTGINVQKYAHENEEHPMDWKYWCTFANLWFSHIFYMQLTWRAVNEVGDRWASHNG